jgi:hypothetical protein
VKLWNERLLEELQVYVNLWLTCLPRLASIRSTLLWFTYDHLMCHLSNNLLQNLLKYLFEDFPGASYLIQNLAEHFET